MSLLFDIGFNEGTFSGLWLEDNPDGKVIGVDANEFYGKRKLADFITFVHCLVSNVNEEEETFFIDHLNPGVSTASERWRKESRFALGSKYVTKGHINWSAKYQVMTRTLDSLIKEYGVPTRIKIDVEGYEAMVLAGLSEYGGLVSFEWTEENWDIIEDCVCSLSKIGYKEFGVAGYFDEGDSFDGLTYDSSGDTYSLFPQTYFSWEDLKPLLTKAIQPERRINYGMFFAK
jgi:FkbM family methyltransferase